MGVLNVTPDSFSDGGQFSAADDAVNHARFLLATGANIIDIGGESTRPGAERVAIEEEQRRVISIIERITKDAAFIDSGTRPRCGCRGCSNHKRRFRRPCRRQHVWRRG
jgi:dihydropteroate synthase